MTPHAHPWAWSKQGRRVAWAPMSVPIVRIGIAVRPLVVHAMVAAPVDNVVLPFGNH